MACFGLFFHDDMWITGHDSLNYLFGNPLSFYENRKKLHGETMVSTPYPPSIYVIFAIWLYPMKLLGWMRSVDDFSQYWIYWLKTLTTIVYAASAAVVYRVSLEYSPHLSAI